jgi:hypothetical protein
MVEVELVEADVDRDVGVPVAGVARDHRVERRVERRALVGEGQRVERLHVTEHQRARRERAADAVVVDRRASLAEPAHDERAAVGEPEVELQPALVPLGRDRLDPHTRQAELAVVVGDPERRALAKVRILRTLGEEVVLRGVHPTGQIDRHVSSRSRRVGA